MTKRGGKTDGQRQRETDGQTDRPRREMGGNTCTLRRRGKERQVEFEGENAFNISFTWAWFSSVQFSASKVQFPKQVQPYAGHIQSHISEASWDDA